MVGKNGITESLIIEIDAALKAHELIKIKFLEAALEIMEQDTAIWLSKLRAELIDTKGHVMTLYRKNPKTSPPTPLHPVERGVKRKPKKKA